MGALSAKTGTVLGRARVTRSPSWGPVWRADWRTDPRTAGPGPVRVTRIVCAHGWVRGRPGLVFVFGPPQEEAAPGRR